MPSVPRLVSVLVLIPLALAACARGVAEDVPPPPSRSPSPSPTFPVPSPSPTASLDASVDVEVFFSNERLGDVCTEVFPVPREVPAHDRVRATVAILLAGPTVEEAAEGYGGWFTPETAQLLEEVTVEDGRALVSFDRSLPDVIPNASTSCGSSALLAQLDHTLTQFPDVDEVWYSLAGDRTAFYHWLQRSAPDDPAP